MNENAYTVQELLRFKEKKKRQGLNLQILQSTKSRDLFCQSTELVPKDVKKTQEKDKTGSKPDRNGKRVEAGKSLKQLQ
nr:hypothetical protein [Tanacetum cinerariifolium]